MNIQESLAVRDRVEEVSIRLEQEVDRLVEMIGHLTKRVENLTRQSTAHRQALDAIVLSSKPNFGGSDA